MRNGEEMKEYIDRLLEDNNIKEIFVGDDAMLRVVDKNNRRKALGLVGASEVLDYVSGMVYLFTLLDCVSRTRNDKLSPVVYDKHGNSRDEIKCFVKLERNIDFYAITGKDKVVFPQFSIRVKDNG